MFWDWWQSLFTDMPAYAFFNFKFLPKYGYAVIQGVEYTLILSVVSVLLAVLPALMLATMRLSKCAPVRWLSGAYIAAFRSTPMLVQLIIIYYGVFNAILVPKFLIFGFLDSTRFIPGVVALALNKNVLPSLANEVVTMIKESSICMMLGMGEIMFAAQTISGSTYIAIGPYMWAAIIYFAINYPTSKVIEHIERRMRRGDKN